MKQASTNPANQFNANIIYEKKKRKNGKETRVIRLYIYMREIEVKNESSVDGSEHADKTANQRQN